MLTYSVCERLFFCVHEDFVDFHGFYKCAVAYKVGEPIVIRFSTFCTTFNSLCAKNKMKNIIFVLKN